MAAATAVRSTAAAVESAATTARMAAAESTAGCATAAIAGACITATISAAVTAAISITTTVAVPTAIAVTAAVSITVTAAEPGTGADEEAAIKPRWAIVTIRSAGIRIVAVITVRADRSRIAVAPNTDAYRHLSVGVSCCRNDQDSE